MLTNSYPLAKFSFIFCLFILSACSNTPNSTTHLKNTSVKKDNFELFFIFHKADRTELSPRLYIDSRHYEFLNQNRNSIFTTDKAYPNILQLSQKSFEVTSGHKLLQLAIYVATKDNNSPKQKFVYIHKPLALEVVLENNETYQIKSKIEAGLIYLWLTNSAGEIISNKVNTQFKQILVSDGNEKSLQTID